MAHKFPNWSPYNYVLNNPMVLIDPKGFEWYHYQADDEDEARWHYHENEAEREIWTGEYDDKGNRITQTVQGILAVIVFQGSINESLNGVGQIDNGASVTVYGQDGNTSTFTGYTMTSDPSLFGTIADGNYRATSRENSTFGPAYALENMGPIPPLGGINPAYPFRMDANGNNFVDEVMLHPTNANAPVTDFAGTFTRANGSTGGISEGCLLVPASQWNNFRNAVGANNNILLQLTRSWPF